MRNQTTVPAATFKGDLCASGPCQQSHTPLTALQELAALILAYAALVDYRVAAAAVGEVGVLRISFVKTLHVVQGLWQSLTLAADLLAVAQVRLLVGRGLRRIAAMAIPNGGSDLVREPCASP